MLKFIKVAVTGGLSCGKSSVCRILKELGAYAVSADEIVHHLLSSDDNIISQVIRLLGKDILVDQKIDRSRVARLVFQDLEQMKELEQILHPAVYSEIKKQYQKQQEAEQPFPLFAAEVPLLFESNGENLFDASIAVLAQADICFKRFNKNEQFSRQEFDMRMSNQLTPLEKAIRADYAIMNNGTISTLKEPVRELFQELLEY
ncbi:MAG: dephospho-CoA kinase [Candidatus Protochlamydia sp.]|nr:dephospho-CoA kinase [Candidatus Protochlamydia sp.]